MRVLIAIFCLLLPAGRAVSQTLPPSPCSSIEPAPENTAWDLVFYADEGIRVDRAALPKPFVDESGLVHLFYQTGNGPGTTKDYYATAADGLTFENGRLQQSADLAFHPFRVRMPNGVWRMYSMMQPTYEMRSRSSGDGVNFGEDFGVRYQLQEADKGWAGIHLTYVDRLDRVVLLYLGDKTGLNNVRRAVSSDNGWSFEFTGGNVLGDSDVARERGPGWAYVDQKVLSLGNGQHRLFAMRQGCAIYSFMENEQGDYALEPGPRVTVNSWPNLQLRSLHDPVIVRLPDGRYRMYVCAGLVVPAGEPVHEVILTATTALPPTTLPVPPGIQ